METGIAKAAKSKFGNENEIQVNINRDNGDIEIFRKLIIVERPENNNTEKLDDPETTFEPLNTQLAKAQVNFDDYGDKLIRSL